MNYRIKVTKQFEKDFTKSKQDLKEGIIKKVDLLKEIRINSRDCMAG